MSAASPGVGPLTVRGVVVLGSGVALVAVGLSLGLPPLVRAGLLALTLPLLAAAVLGLARPRARVERTLEPPVVPVGDASRVRLRVHVAASLPLRTLRAEDSRSPGLTGRSRFVLATSTARSAGHDRDRDRDRDRDASITVTYRVQALRRGEHTVGPLTITAADRLDLVRGVRVPVRAPGSADGSRAPENAVLLALPRTVALPPRRRATGATGSRGSTATSTRTGEERAAAVREYVTGDDVRRIHWRASARADRLMVAQEEEPLASRAVLVLDTGGRWSPASFERAVTVAASVLVALGDDGREVELHAGDQVQRGRAAELLRTLATVEPDDTGARAGRASASRSARGDRPRAPATPARVVRVVSGEADRGGAPPPPGTALAPAVIVVDGRGDPPPAAAAHLRAGWQVALVPPATDLDHALPRAWSSLDDGPSVVTSVRAPARSTA